MRGGAAQRGRASTRKVLGQAGSCTGKVVHKSESSQCVDFRVDSCRPVHRAPLVEPFRLMCSGPSEVDLIGSYGCSKSKNCARDSCADSCRAKCSTLTADGRGAAAAKLAPGRLLDLPQHLQAPAAQGQPAQEDGRGTWVSVLRRCCGAAGGHPQLRAADPAQDGRLTMRSMPRYCSQHP